MPPEAEPNETLAEMPVVVNSEVFSMYLFFLSDCALVLLCAGFELPAVIHPGEGLDPPFRYKLSPIIVRNAILVACQDLHIVRCRR